MKTVVISGVPRSGKSLLAQSIYDATKCSVMHLDMLCGCARGAFSVPFSNRDDPNNIFGLMDDFQDFLIRTIKNIGHEFEYARVFESTFLEPKEVAEKIASTEYICIYMGYPSIEPENKLIQSRNYGSSNPQCWTNGELDSKMLNHLLHFVEVSRKQETECRKYGIPFFDSSVDFETTFLDVKSYIMGRLSEV